MIPLDNDRRVDQKLKHFQAALNSSNKSHLERAIQKLGSLNNQISATNCLKLRDSELIGNTALYLAFLSDNLEAFCMLLSRGVDFTLKNQDGLTVLHLILKSIIVNARSRRNFAMGRLDSPFISAVLAAHIERRECANPCDPNGLSHFHLACITNNVAAVEFFLESSVSLNDRVSGKSSFPGYTPLHFAVRHFSLQVVEVLLNRGASIHTKDAKGMTPLQILLERNFEMVSLVDSDSKSSTIKQERNLSDKIARLLLAKAGGIDVMIIDDMGLSCLHVASALMDLSAVEQILEKVTNFNHCVNLDSSLWAGYTALHFAAFFDIDIVKILVRRGADLQAKDSKGITPLDLCLERYRVEDIHSILSLKDDWKDIKLSNRKTKLLDLITAMISYENFNKFLERVTKNKIITVSNNSPVWPGFTPMHLVVLFARNIAKKTSLEILLALFLKNEKMIETKDISSCTPLHLCFRLGKRHHVANLLITLHQKLDNPLDLVDKDNLSLLHIACANGNEDFVNKLLLQGNNVNRTYKGKTTEGRIARGWTPLHLAVVHREKNHLSSFNDKGGNIVRALLKCGANVNAQDAHGLTPVHLLVLPNISDYILSYFNKHGCDTVDDILLSSPRLKEVVAGDSGLSHLHVACSRGREDISRKLVDTGADVNRAIRYLPKIFANTEGSSEDSIEYMNATPLHLALNSCLNNKVVEFLLQHGADIFVQNSEGVPLFYKALGNAIFIKLLRENQDLQVQAEKDIGLTMLHVACEIGDTSLVENLLDSGTDVNARISFSSPIWPGYTPLHIALRNGPYMDHNNDLLRLLLERKADVTLPDAKQRTPLHVAFQHYISQLYYCGVKEATFEYLTMMLKAHRNFKVNPTSVEGITHFHIACSLADEAVVEKFLKYGCVDVDQSIDFFFKNEGRFKSFQGAGCSPLHLAVMKKNSDRNEFVEFQSQLETVDLLLKHGANVNSENAWGKTPFHVAIRFEIRERLVRGGAYVDSKDAYGFTTLQNLLLKRPESSDTIKELLRCGCRYNACDSDTGIGCVGLTMRSMPLKEMQKLVSMAVINFPDVMKPDECGRTMIHNLVSIYQINVSDTDYATLIEQMMKIGYHVDDQDQLGRTALHIAVEFKNLRAISGLLLAGADINITNVNGQTPLAHRFQPCSWCDQPTDSEDEQCEHYKVFKVLSQQVKKLQICGIDVHPINRDIAATSFSSFSSVNVSDRFTSELEELKNIRIGSYRLTLHDFMSEVKAVADYPTMSEAKQNAISEFFLPNEEYRQFREKYSEVAGLLRLQYKKAVERTELVRKAKRSLDLLTGIPVPEVCSRIILQFLTNSELRNTIASC